LECGQVIIWLCRRSDGQYIVIFCVGNVRNVFFLQVTATPKVESVYASSQVCTIGFHTGEGEHTHTGFSSASTHTRKMPDVAARPCKMKIFLNKFVYKSTTIKTVITRAAKKRTLSNLRVRGVCKGKFVIF
jgi:hypothetical protein